MASTKFIQHSIPAHHALPPKSVITSKLHSPNHNNKNLIRFTENPFSFCSHSSFKSPQTLSSNLSAPSHHDFLTTEQEPTDRTTIKERLFAALQGINRGIFGVSSEKKWEIESFVDLLESRNPTPDPTLCLEKLDGNWRLIYGTITILGSKRTKLGLRDFITLGDLFQSINVAEGKAVNTAKFSARGLSLLSGHLTIEASFKIASKSRVDITYNKSGITPDQLMNVFRKNYDLLLGIFNPEGWLEITYVDDCLRIGRDDKGNIFILERLVGDNP